MKISVNQLLKQLQTESFSIDEQPYSLLFHIYHQEFLNHSVEKGLIDTNSLVIAGDSTPFVTSAREYWHRICNCAEKALPILTVTVIFLNRIVT